MRERVDLNAAGVSIESPAKLYKGGRWTSRYILCKKQPDLLQPIFMVYKNQATRHHHQNYKASFSLQNFVGLETGFELKKQTHTLSILTKEEVIVLAFSLPENLVIWESWLKANCGQSQMFYVQLLRVPKYSLADHLVKKEVRLHLHDSCFALVHGRPQIVLEFVHTDEARVVDMKPNMFTFGNKDCQTKEESYTICAARLPVFYTMLEKARRNQDDLHSYLNSKTSDGDWIPEVSAFVRAHSLRSNPSENIRNLMSYMNTPILPRASNLDKGKSKSGNHVSLLQDRRVRTLDMNRANSLANNYYNTSSIHSPYFERARASSDAHNYVNIIEVGGTSDSRDSSYRSRIYIAGNGDSSVHYCNIYDSGIVHDPNNASGNMRSNSLPDYVNIEHGMVLPPKSPNYQKKYHKISLAENFYSNVARPSTSTAQDDRRRSDQSVWINRDKNRSSYGKQRSMVDFPTAAEPQEKQENWKRAKKFISAFKPKSENHLSGSKKREMTKSNSTSALSFASPARKKHHSSISSFASDHSHDEDSPPPALNIAMNNPLLGMPFQRGARPPDGLVKVNDQQATMIKPRAGVSGILAKRLHTAVRGSFSKYDGERATHHYNMGKGDALQLSPKNKGESSAEAKTNEDPLNGIMSAIKSGQERLKESDRRASTVSFKQNLLLLPKRLSKTISQSAQHTIRNSSMSGSTRNSNDSLSSDARSKISYKKRSSSPPRIAAPVLPYRPPSQRTLVFQSNRGSSIDSFNSHQTARSSSPVPLPRKTIPSVDSTPSIRSEVLRQHTRLDYCNLANPKSGNGSTSSNSIGSRSEYVSICPTGTKAAQQVGSGFQSVK
ncbi:unnamed protein product, partial [Mesorhabditis spiculigera]